ncbi:hypothetical protein HC752_02710 [Vibrio sp. S9_S30]|uniref:hypothetical protein n=1 Tax=Vibrio sp. S9_S30 TaxID=2720226 RepID=UPI0016804041|nr:hypothetical protein [Vibrio sp. S9_S30]MBD1555849.1 hypothetical protein [Vibrio sp. S9_S30]
MSIKGLTWDHPRGYQALQSSLKWAHCPLEQWDVQPLSGFEETPLHKLADLYDLLVIDHPHLGQAIESDCLQPLDAHLSPLWLEGLKDRCIGKTAHSYWLDNHCWALPLDASSQIMAYRSESRDTTLAINGWLDLLRTQSRFQLCLAGPHATLQLLALSLAVGSSGPNNHQFMSTHDGVEAVDLMKSLFLASVAPSTFLNPIEILDALSNTSKFDLCPFVYGYVNYSQTPATVEVCAPPNNVSILGGTGIAITKKCHISNELLLYLKKLLSSDIQNTFIPKHAGQPSFKSAWRNTEVNQQVNHFYRHAYATVDNAYLRPRHTGYIEFQDRAAQLIREGLTNRTSSKQLVKEMNLLYSKTRRNGHGTRSE